MGEVGLRKLKDIQEAAQMYVLASPDLFSSFEKVGMFVHVYAHCSVNSFHLHILDMDYLGPTYEKLAYKNLPLEDVIAVLEEEAGVTPVSPSQLSRRRMIIEEETHVACPGPWRYS